MDLNIDVYDTIMIGYPNWWASIPATIRTFLTRYDVSGKTIIPFCTHGGGLFGQTISTVAKLAPNSTIKEGLGIHYSSYNDDEISAWLTANNIPVQ
jgi:flavodoxin